jgi:hypothetical protein
MVMAGGETLSIILHLTSINHTTVSVITVTTRILSLFPHQGGNLQLQGREVSLAGPLHPQLAIMIATKHLDLDTPKITIPMAITIVEGTETLIIVVEMAMDIVEGVTMAGEEMGTRIDVKRTFHCNEQSP